MTFVLYFYIRPDSQCRVGHPCARTLAQNTVSVACFSPDKPGSCTIDMSLILLLFGQSH